jgi:dTDP-glucose pyrophosphorylase
VKLVDEVIEKVKSAKPDDAKAAITQVVSNWLSDKNRNLPEKSARVNTVLVVGVNGTGKTTSVAKLANRLKSDGNSVLLAAADTFRAAATDQLQTWANRIGIEVVTGEVNSDPASVAFSAISKATELKINYLIVDTAGRLHTKQNLMNELGKVIRVVEKPTIPKSNKALVGLYKIQASQVLFECLESNITNNYRTKGEFHLTDGLQCMIEKGIAFKAFKVNNWFDCGKKDVLLETSSMLLKRAGSEINQQQFENTIIIDPVNIATNCIIKNAIIGPNVAVGEGTSIQNAIIRDSIIGEFTKLEEVVLHHSVVGSDAFIKGSSQSLNIGDNTEIDLS